MQKILRKRTLRELKENFWRYLALMVLIVLGMYLVISVVGAAETVIRGVDKNAVESNLEDGEFLVFVPLTDGQKEIITGQGVTLEEEFYLDFQGVDDSVLRIFKNREKINQLVLEEGKTASARDEIVLERRYCTENGLQVGETVSIGAKSYTIVGIATTPDYDAPYKKLSDMAVDSKQFGTGFVCEEEYEALKKENSSEKSEEYVYAYLLNEKLTDQELKKLLQDMKISPEAVKDEAFLEYWAETGGKKEDLEEGLEELTDGTKELKNALKELKGSNASLQEGTGEIFDSYLKQAGEGLAPYGLTKELTEDNFEQNLEQLEKSSESAILRLEIEAIKEQLKQLKTFKDGITEYTEGVAKAEDGSKEVYDGMSRLKKEADELIDSYFNIELSNLIQFIPVEDNPRVRASADDQIINKLAGLAAGVIIMVLFTYVISVFVIHGIEKESSVIGALYAMGVKKKELLRHYLTLPVLITLFAGMTGTALGFSKFGINTQLEDSFNYFSTPTLPVQYPLYLLIYGMVMPPAAAVLVNYIVIRKKLSQTALSLIRNNQKQSRAAGLDLKNMGFIRRFQIRQILRESRSVLTVLFGMFISLLIMMMGIDCYVLCSHIGTESKEDTKYEYMYTYKYPQKEVPKGAEACYAKTLKKEIFGYNLDVMLLGIDDHNPYFDAKVEEGMEEVVISSAMAQKYQLSLGEELVLRDEEEERNYVFTIKAITQYSPGLYAFMDIDSMRKLFNEDDEYYNVVFADKKLNIDPKRLYAITTKEEIAKSSDVFINMMAPMVIMMTGVSIFVFCVVMYLMMKVMIDRSAFSISLIKVFGFRMKEIRKLYLDGNFYLIALGAAICIPASKKVMDSMYPVLVSNVSCGMNLTFTWQMYVGIYGAILLLYLLIRAMLVRKLKHIVPTEVLKNRE